MLSRLWTTGSREASDQVTSAVMIMMTIIVRDNDNDIDQVTKAVSFFVPDGLGDRNEVVRRDT